MKSSEDDLRQRLNSFGQAHVLAFWNDLNAGQRERLAAQIRAIDLAQIDTLFRGGLTSNNWSELAMRATAPPAIRLHDGHPAIDSQDALARGAESLQEGHVGVVLVAGGQGTRLGFDRPKGMLSIGPVSGASLFRILLEKIVARSRASGRSIPLYLMTSPATHDETIEYLRAHANFGLPSEGVNIFCQGTMPAIDARSGRLLLAEKDQLALGPDGHGGMLQALEESGCLNDIERRGLKQLFYCQIDNPLVEMCDPRFLGYHVLARSDLSTQVVAKQTPRDKVGNVVAIDGRLHIIEYSDLNSLGDEIVCCECPDGSPVFWAGNTAIHVFDASFLRRMSKIRTALPFHVAKKTVAYVDASGRKVTPTEPNAIKFERFIFDLLPAARLGIVVEVDEAQAFAPVKNATGEKRDTPESVQAQMIALHTSWLQAAGCQVAPGVAVEISPLFAQNAQEVAARMDRAVVVTQPQYFC